RRLAALLRCLRVRTPRGRARSGGRQGLRRDARRPHRGGEPARTRLDVHDHAAVEPARRLSGEDPTVAPAARRRVGGAEQPRMHPAAGLFGATMLAVWISDVAALARIRPLVDAMKANTALGFVLVGIALSLGAT